MKKSELLKKAKELICSDTETYICRAIENASRKNNVYELFNPLYNWIHQDLLTTRYNDYGHWLSTEHPEYKDLRYQGRGYKTGRLQWLDWMIEYWKEKGE
jgi:hypothetical protein